MLSQVACIIFVAVVLSYHGLVDFFISHVFCLRDKKKTIGRLKISYVFCTCNDLY
jgi:hypothetical protein